MQLTPRTRVVAAIAAVAVAVTLAAVATGRGCAPVDASPESAARAFVTATRGGDRRAVWVLLGPATKTRLEAEARGATERVGGTRRFAAPEMLMISVGPTTWAPSGYRVLDGGDGETTAHVEVRGASGQRDVLELTRVDGRWRVELPLSPPVIPLRQ